MNRIIALIAILTLPLLTLADVGDADEALEAVIDSAQLSVSAKQISRAPPAYPRLELRRGREAWVHITYCIDESGAIQNVSVLDSVGNNRFDRAAIATVQKWEYEPALRNGSPVWQSGNNVLISFALEGGQRGASRRFSSRYRKIGKLIDEDNLAEADELFWKTYETDDLNMYELAMLWVQRVRHEGIVGDMYRLDMALRRATASHGEWIDKETYVRLLALRAKVELSLGKYSQARHSYKDLTKETADDAEEVLALQPAFDYLTDLIASDDVINIDAEIRSRGDCAFCDDSWYFTPVRRDFTFQNIKGSLRSIDMRCKNKRYESDAMELVEWHIPEQWGKCQVQVYGEPGTTFNVLMLPTSSD